MNKQDMIDTVKDDLLHIPDGTDEQNELRMLFNSHRRKDLTNGKLKNETLAYCIEVIKKSYPSWQPDFDKAYFES